jgi:3-deoxy-D-manno-octulosonic-acid transferase
VLQCADWIAVQGEADRMRFLRIGAPAERLRIMGDLKMGAAAAGAGRYGSRPGRREEEVLRSWQEALGGERPLLVAGSTHAPEERWLLSALSELRGGAPGGPRLLLAPRRPERAAALCRMARRRGLSAHRFSAGPRNGWDVLVLDEMGWLAALYGAGALAFVGGTLARRGGHTPIEAAAHGLPLLAGPHREHIAELAGDLERAGGLLGVRSTRGLASAWRALLADPAERLRMGAAARAVVADGEVIAARYARAVLAVAAGRAPAAPAVGTPSTELTALASPRSVRSVEHPG